MKLVPFLKLMRENLHYRPASLRSQVDCEQIRTYYLECWPRLRDIWHKAGALEEAFRPENPLEKWRECIEAIYQIDLPLNLKRK